MHLDSCFGQRMEFILHIRMKTKCREPQKSLICNVRDFLTAVNSHLCAGILQHMWQKAERSQFLHLHPASYPLFLVKISDFKER